MIRALRQGREPVCPDRTVPAAVTVEGFIVRAVAHKKRHPKVPSCQNLSTIVDQNWTPTEAMAASIL
jgi:hypothetical protein